MNTFRNNEKIHLTMKEKKIFSLNVEHIHFLVIRAGWLVTKIHAHYTFEQFVF